MDISMFTSLGLMDGGKPTPGTELFASYYFAAARQSYRYLPFQVDIVSWYPITEKGTGLVPGRDLAGQMYQAYLNPSGVNYLMEDGVPFDYQEIVDWTMDLDGQRRYAKWVQYRYYMCTGSPGVREKWKMVRELAE
jgi:hypothetical protein